MNHPAYRPTTRFDRPFLPVRAGFTLIELLVVVGIIAVLLGILAPAVKGVMEMARQGQCLSNLHEMALGQRTYATSPINMGSYVTGIPNVDGGTNLPGPECVWINKATPTGYTQGHYRSHGVLVNLKYLGSGLLYCPSWDVETWLPGNSTMASGIDGWTFPSAGRVGGWVSGVADSGPQAYMAMVSTYFTRTTFGGVAYTEYMKWRPAMAGDDPESQALMAEAFYGPTTTTSGAAVMGLRTTHAGPLGTVYLDNHAEMVTPTNSRGLDVFKNFPVGTFAWGADITLYGNIERVFNEFLSKTVK